MYKERESVPLYRCNELSAFRRPLRLTATAFECFFSNRLEGDNTNTSRLGNNAADGGSGVSGVLVAGGPGSL
jgi:hypothetical protein